MILLTGVTGKTGGATANVLAAQNVPLRALVRNEEKAAPLKESGIDLVVGDLADKSVVEKALEGVDKALLIAPNSDQQLNIEKQFTDCAENAGVRHIVKMSSMEAVPGTDGIIPGIHIQSEDHIKASKMSWTMIKPNFFMQNLLASAVTIREQQKLFLPMREGKTGMSDVRDLGEIIAKVLTEDGHENKSYELTGPELLSFGDVADRFSEVLGTKIEYVNMPLDAYMKTIAPFLTNEWHVNAVADLFAEIAEGGLDHLTDTMSEILGRPPISLVQFIQNHISAFKAG